MFLISICFYGKQPQMFLFLFSIQWWAHSQGLCSLPMGSAMPNFRWILQSILSAIKFWLGESAQECIRTWVCEWVPPPPSGSSRRMCFWSIFKQKWNMHAWISHELDKLNICLGEKALENLLIRKLLWYTMWLIRSVNKILGHSYTESNSNVTLFMKW